MKTSLLISYVTLSLALVGCLETTHSYRLCNSGNRTAVPDLTQGTYELGPANGGVVTKGSLIKGLATGTYFFANVDDPDTVTLGQSCTLDGIQYLEFEPEGSGGGFALMRIFPGKKSWRLQLLQPDLKRVALAKIPVIDVSAKGFLTIRQKIYNHGDMAGATGGSKLSLSLFELSTSNEGTWSLTKTP